jgi:hypothetical protein
MEGSIQNSLLSAVSINKKSGKIPAVCDSWLKGCRTERFLLPGSWENCSIYSEITSHMSADHSYSAVIDILEVNKKRSHLMKSASYQTGKWPCVHCHQ